MTSPQKIAVLDIGKTNAKVVVLDCLTGEEIAEKRMVNRVLPGPPYAHYDIDALRAFTLDALKDFAHDPGFDAISITTHGASAALIDAHGELALPVLDYEQAYPQAICAAYARLRPDFSETFSPALSVGLNLGAQMHYQKTAFPEEFARTAAILTYPQYWAFRLTGVAANEATSLGCHTDLWNPQAGTFSSLVDTLDIRQLMAPVRSAFDTLGTVLPDICQAIGLEKPVPVHCGIHDSNASLLAHLIGREPPFAVVSTGTWVISFAVGGDLSRLDPSRDTLANVDAYGRAVPSSRFMGGREFELLAASLGSFSAEEATAAMPSVIRRQIMLLPNLAGGSGPFPGQTSRWVNEEGASPGERWAAACLYLALMTQTCLGLIGAKGPTLVEGPFAANPLYLSVLRALLGRSVMALPGSTGTSQGAALLGGKAGGAKTATEVAPPEWQVEAYRKTWLAQTEDVARITSVA